MNGAEALLNTLVDCGVTHCFGNPGTSEMHFVAALDRVSGMKPVLALSESVATGAADGYARISGVPAAVLLHCGPGLANGIANLHNAQKAQVPIVNLIGDQAQLHRPLAPGLAAETENLARTVSQWTRTARDAYTVGRDAACAVAAARAGGTPGVGDIASLILPSDVCWGEGAAVASPMALAPRPQATDALIGQAATWCRQGGGTALLLGTGALHGRALQWAGAIAQRFGVRLLCNSAMPRMRRGRGAPPVERIPYAVGPALDKMRGVQHMLLVGSRRPVLSFAGPHGEPGRPEPEGLRIGVLATAEEDMEDALQRLASALGCDAGSLEAVDALTDPKREPPQVALGPITPESFAQSLAALLPAQSIVVDEGVTFGRASFEPTMHAATHDWLQLTGGAIGSGIPMATGAAMADHSRRVVNLQADGSAAFTLQGLWTQAREKLNVTTVIFSNRKYAILYDEMRRVGASPGPNTDALFQLDQPALDWCKLAQGFGVESARADSMEELNRLFERSCKTDGPFLIELML